MKCGEVEVIGERGSGDRSRSASGHFEGRTPQNENALILESGQGVSNRWERENPVPRRGEG